MRHVVLCAVAVSALLLVGCTPPDGRVAVQGTVQFNGKPLDSGTIQFHPLDTAGPSSFAGGEVTDGKFTVPAAQGLYPGKYKVMISSPDAVMKDPGVPGESGPPAKDRIPKKYNAESKEVVEVKATGDNRFEFDLK